MLELIPNHPVKSSVSDVQISVFMIVSELASDNVDRVQRHAAYHMNSMSGAFTMFISGSG